jgi:hypothetical protein
MHSRAQTSQNTCKNSNKRRKQPNRPRKTGLHTAHVNHWRHKHHRHRNRVLKQTAVESTRETTNEFRPCDDTTTRRSVICNLDRLQRRRSNPLRRPGRRTVAHTAAADTASCTAAWRGPCIHCQPAYRKRQRGLEAEQQARVARPLAQTYQDPPPQTWYQQGNWHPALRAGRTRKTCLQQTATGLGSEGSPASNGLEHHRKCQSGRHDVKSPHRQLTRDIAVAANVTRGKRFRHCTGWRANKATTTVATPVATTVAVAMATSVAAAIAAVRAMTAGTRAMATGARAMVITRLPRFTRAIFVHGRDWTVRTPVA